MRERSKGQESTSLQVAKEERSTSCSRLDPYEQDPLENHMMLYELQENENPIKSLRRASGRQRKPEPKIRKDCRESLHTRPKRSGSVLRLFEESWSWRSWGLTTSRC